MGGSVVFGDVTPHTEKWVSQIFFVTPQAKYRATPLSKRWVSQIFIIQKGGSPRIYYFYKTSMESICF